MSRLSTLAAPVQTPAQDRTKGPVGLSGTVHEVHVIQPRVHGDLVALIVTIVCGDIRCHITQMFDDAESAHEARRKVPPGSHVTAFGAAPDLQMKDGELHLASSNVITYALVTDFTQRNLFSAVG